MALPSPPCRLLIDPQGHGSWNMAVDEALLESAAGDGRCTLRFYQWGEPTLSLGYFQRYADRFGHTPSRDCPAVRRSSGGGAILHDAEWTYSFTAPATSPLAVKADALYRLIHDALINALAYWGVEVRYWDAEPLVPSTEEPFLCFARRSANDLVLGDAKIAGSAQRRRRGALLQHGSLILGRSPAAPEIAGVRDLVDGEFQVSELLGRWRERITEGLGVELVAQSLSEDELSRAKELEARKYAADDWNRKR